MKKIVLLIVLFSAFSTLLFSQEITEKLKWEKIFDIAANSKNIVNWERDGLVDADSADLRLAENKLEIIELLSGEVVEPVEPEVIEELSPEAQAVIDYLKSIPDLSLEKIDIQELWKGYTPIQTSTVWRNATIKMWMDLNDCFYYKSWTKAKLIAGVRECLGQ